MRILITEDDDMSRLILQTAVEQFGHECLQARDGLEAWTMFQSEQVDVVISDWLMPGMDGIELCRRVRSLAHPAYTYFIFVTSLADKSDVLKGIDAGADDYLTKPLDTGELQIRLAVACRVTALHHKMAEQAELLAKNNQRLQSALDTVQASESRLVESQHIARLGSWTFDPASGDANWSSEMYSLLGVDPAQGPQVGQAFLRLIHPEDRLQYAETVAVAVRESRGFDYLFRIMLDKGGVRWVHALGRPVVDERGRTTTLRGTLRDVTEQKLKEDALARAHAESAAARATLVDAIESLTDAFALFDADDRLILCNRHYAQAFTAFERFEEIAGISFAELVRSSVAKGEVIAPEFNGDVEAWVAERVRAHRNPGLTPRLLQIGGGRWLEVTERPTRSGGLVGVRRDVTERKRLEQRQAMQHAVTLLLAQSETVAEVMPKIIQTVCQTLGWDCGAWWAMHEQDGSLHCAETWSIDSNEIREYAKASSEMTFAPESVGLLRRVCATGEPIWISDVTGNVGFKRAHLALKAGLHGAFAFPIKIGNELFGVMEFYIREVRDPDPALLEITHSIGSQMGQFIARKSAEGKIRQLAHFDHLTGLPNRNLFNEFLTHGLIKAQRRGAPLGLLFIDLDGFKGVNDRYGHDAGDVVLATFGQRLRECLRKSDVTARLDALSTPARLGGDEFIVFVDDFTEAQQLAVVAKKVLVAARTPFVVMGQELTVGASIGISVFPQDGEEAKTLLKAADSAMYRAKKGGKNHYRFYSALPPGLSQKSVAPAVLGAGRQP